MTDRELMQEALDALEGYARNCQCEGGGAPCDAAEALRARLAQPEPEPVAKMREMLEVQGRDGTWNYDTYSQGMYNGMEFMVALAEGREPVFREPPERWLHTPPQREWQGLTDDEVRDFWSWSMTQDAEHIANTQQHAFARAIEAKLKEKNT